MTRFELQSELVQLKLVQLKLDCNQSQMAIQAW